MQGKKGMSDSSMSMDSSMCCMMEMKAMHKMLPQLVVATTDGGIVVLSGTRLLKYDKDLNFKKEVEIEMDSLAMQNMMMMMSKCPMMKPMQKGMKMSNNTPSRDSSAGYWTCPMHPEIHKAESGNCPICGMKLVFKKNDTNTAKMKK